MPDRSKGRSQAKGSPCDGVTYKTEFSNKCTDVGCEDNDEVREVRKYQKGNG